MSQCPKCRAFVSKLQLRVRPTAINSSIWLLRALLRLLASTARQYFFTTSCTRRCFMTDYEPLHSTQNRSQKEVILNTTYYALNHVLVNRRRLSTAVVEPPRTQKLRATSRKTVRKLPAPPVYDKNAAKRDESPDPAPLKPGNISSAKYFMNISRSCVMSVSKTLLIT